MLKKYLKPQPLTCIVSAMLGDQIPLLFTTIWGDQPAVIGRYKLRQGFVPGRYHFVHLGRDVTKKPTQPRYSTWKCWKFTQLGR